MILETIIIPAKKIMEIQEINPNHFSCGDKKKKCCKKYRKKNKKACKKCPLNHA